MEKRIIDDIKKSGIPTEIRVSSILRRKGWDVTNQFPYNDGGITRPIDIFAIKMVSSNMMLGLVIECKKSEKPWVFYMLQKEGQMLQLGLSVISMLKSLAPVFSKIQVKSMDIQGLNDFLGKIHYAIMNKIGVISYTPFRKQNSESDEFFEARKQVVAAVNYIESQNQNQGQIKYIIYPLIVFEGSIYEMELLTDMEPSVSPVDHLVYINFDLQKKILPIDIVRTEFLEKYLDSIDKDIEAFKSIMQIK